MEVRNQFRITQTAATVRELTGIGGLKKADVPNPAVLAGASSVYGERRLERVLLYNPDAIALWLHQKYTERFIPVLKHSELALPVLSVMPSVTPVCFASMYSGLNPSEHGIRAYVKPVLKCETLFDAMISAGKKPAIISTAGDSISEIFKGREMDYYFFDTPEEVNAAAEKILREDRYDLITVYNGNFDEQMHRTGPESDEAMAMLDMNAAAYAKLASMAHEIWKDVPHMCAFLPDHGCHEIDGGMGSHGLDMEEDMNIIHFYSFR